MNLFKTSDIKISTDSSGAMTAEHKHQGVLIESMYFEDRKECRREAVIALKEIKEESEEWN